MRPGDIRTHVHAASALLKAIGNERRLAILCHLAEGERSVRALEHQVGLSQSALSQHLARLRRDGLVATRRDAQTIYYSLHGPNVPTILRALHDIYCAQGIGGGVSERAAAARAEV